MVVSWDRDIFFGNPFEDEQDIEEDEDDFFRDYDVADPYEDWDSDEDGFDDEPVDLPYHCDYLY